MAISVRIRSFLGGSLSLFSLVTCWASSGIDGICAWVNHGSRGARLHRARIDFGGSSCKVQHVVVTTAASRNECVPICTGLSWREYVKVNSSSEAHVLRIACSCKYCVAAFGNETASRLSILSTRLCYFVVVVCVVARRLHPAFRRTFAHHLVLHIAQTHDIGQA